MRKFVGAFAVQTSSSRCTIVAYSSSIVMTEIQANGELAFKSLNDQWLFPMVQGSRHFAEMSGA